MRIDLEECRRLCLKNCSCTAYANADIKSGCILWFDDLIDVLGYAEGQDLYVRMPKSELGMALLYKLKLIFSSNLKN